MRDKFEAEKTHLQNGTLTFNSFTRLCLLTLVCP